LESQIAQIWAKILKLDRVGRQDNFFELGGHSLLAVRMMSRLRQVSGRAVEIQELFAHPVLGDLAKALGEAAQAEREVIPRAERSGALPLSFAQQRLWFLAQLEGLSQVYHSAGGFHLTGALDRAALRRALNRIVERHESLRTTFHLVDGEPVQRIEPIEESKFALIEHDLQEHAEAEQELERIAREEAGAEFDLERGPLIRGRLIRLKDEGEEERHALLFTMHHIVSDGWSMGVMGEELSALYGAYREKKEDPLPELGIQYADYAVWQRRQMEGTLLKRQTEYWKQALAGAPALLELPANHARPAQQNYAGAMVELVLDEELTAGLKELSQRRGVTLYMTLLAGWAAVLSRLSGQTEVVIGTPAANRGHMQLEGLIGFFINMLAVRVNLGGSPTGEELLERVKRATVGTQANQDMPFDQVVELVQPLRSTAHSPVFQAMLVWENTQPVALAFAGVQVTPLRVEVSASAKFDVTISLREQGGKIVGGLTYATALYERETMERHAEYLRNLLRELVTDASVVVELLPMSSETEREQVLYGWNRTEVEYPKDRCIHELFEEQAAGNRGAVAVVYEGASLSYAELNQQANQLAHYLRELGLGPDRRAALCVERGLEMIVGLLAVLKAGGAYVPLDPEYPQERLRFMLEDSTPVVLLTQVHLLERFGDGELPLVVDLCGDNRPWEQMPENNLSAADCGLTAGHLAYVIYTSGSTGLPKGVMVEHRSICNYLRWAQDSYYVGVGNGSPAVHSVGFDGLLTTLFCPILAGETLTLLPSGGEIDALVEHSRKGEPPYTLLKLTPSHLRLLNQKIAGEGAAAPTQRLMIGGEPMVAADVASWQRRFPEVKLSNHFGPTETSVGSCSFEIMETITASTSVPIGKPISNTRIYILDCAGEPVPVGVTGEIYIGGVGVGRGYLNRPELTAERFVSDPFAREAGTRMYKTGDLGRWRTDGNIEFLGRNDFQVKIRGFRIELGEIEARLREHKAVREAVVIALEDEPGDKRLVAYYTVNEDVSVERLRAHLMTRLPEYMVPSGWMQLDVLPLTPNGKLDRKALPAPTMQAYTGDSYEEPQGEVENQIAQIWAEILKLDRVGRQDNFFELGGHSLLAVTLMERLRRSGLRTDLRTLFTLPTVAALAATMDGPGIVGEVDVPANLIPAGCDTILPKMLPLIQLSEQDIARITERVPGGAGNVQDIYPLSPLQSGILFHHMTAEEGDPYLYALLLGFDSRERVDAYLEALGSVICRHDILRTAVLWENLPEPVQVVWRKAVLAVEEVELDTVAGETAKNLYGLRRQRMDVRQAPMLRATIAADGKSARWVMLLQYHHLVSDHTTVEVVHEEIEAYLRGEMERLPAPLPFRNLVAQARLGKSQAEHESFFRRMLEDVDEPTAPFGLLRVRGDGTGTGEARLELEPELSGRMRAQARRLGVSAASVFHQAWGQVLARLTGREEVVFGTVLLGRMQGGEGSDRALGMFINTLPVRIGVGQRGAEKSVRQTHALLGRLIENEHAPLALAQRCSGVVAPLPLFTTMLNYRHSARSITTAAWEGVDVLLVEERTNYPLTLSVDDLGDGFRLTVLADGSVDAARIRGYMERALAGIVTALESAPQTPVHMIDVLPVQERHQVLQEWNETVAEYEREKCIHELFEEQVARRPKSVAVVFEEKELTYAELNCRANQLAHYLRDMGVGAEVRVGISMERSLEAVIGLLGVWKAGGVYVPVDPGYPAERLSYMLEDAQVPVLLTQEHLVDRLPVSWTQVVSVDSRWQEIAEHSEENPEIELDPQNMAYVIYTSGSTGQPKAVVVEHRGLCNMVKAQIRGFGVEVESRILQFASFSFDASVWEFMMALCRGAVLHMPGPGAVLMEETLAGMLAEHGITHVTLPPAVLATLGEEEGLDSVRTLIVAGDTLTEELAEKWVHGRELINAYGPTETTVCATMHRWENGTGKPPIGRPIANTRVYILDRYGEPAPVGVTGEIYIGGAGVARGYLNRPELTAERFVADPFALEPGARMYKAGDLGRWLADGNIDFLGRNDFQVKIRGFRIELGEVEARLREYAGVREAVVMAREDEPGDKCLVAYYTASQAGEEVSVEELRTYLEAKLPEYMVPTKWVQLDALPLTPNGKLDRKALPASPAQSLAGRGYEAPQGELESQIAGIWAEILKVERVGRHDSFFELGGHSLLAVRLASRLREAFDVDVPINDVFARPVLTSLAEYVLDKQLELYDPAFLSEALQYMNRSPVGKEEGREQPQPTADKSRL
jgi:amino acid adenylation domain-containing protein